MMTRNWRITVPAVLFAALALGGARPCRAALKPAKRPFLWMNEQEIEAARKHWNEPWARAAFERSLNCGGGRRGPTRTFEALFRYAVLGDRAAGEAQKRSLLRFRGYDVSRDKQSKPWHDAIEHVLRYDTLYDLLTPEERAAVEATFRNYVRWQFTDYWRITQAKEKGAPVFTRTNWLPNMLYPRIQGAMLMALALQDEALIRLAYESPAGGFKWYMGEYVADGRFYMEEFGKQYSTFGELLLWCRGCKRLGLDEMGFGHVGSNGATMRKYCHAWIDLGFPESPCKPGGTPRFLHVPMGDASPSVMVRGYPPGAGNANAYWILAKMNGPAPRMLAPLWFEMAQAQWPGVGFDWLLAQKRMPGQDAYYPSLFFGLAPIPTNSVTAPAVASYVAPERGFGMLRMEESPAYWRSPRPALALQFGMYYVHYVHDCFTLLAYHQYNRKLYGTRASGNGIPLELSAAVARATAGGNGVMVDGAWPRPARRPDMPPPVAVRDLLRPDGYDNMLAAYAGGHYWLDSTRGRNGIVVDKARITPVDSGEDGSRNTAIRHAFSAQAKFLGIRAKAWDPARGGAQRGAAAARTSHGLFRGVDVERALVLTDDYLLDVFNLVSDDEHLYEWNHHPYGSPRRDPSVVWQPCNAGAGQSKKAPTPGIALSKAYFRDAGDRSWLLDVASKSDAGVRIRMLGETNTVVFLSSDGNLTTTLVQRRTPSTCFVALHEPYEDNDASVRAFERLAVTRETVGVRVCCGEGETVVDDRLFVALGDAAGRTLSVSHGGDRYAFADYAHIRITAQAVSIAGRLRSARFRVPSPDVALTVNGKATPPTVKDGYLHIGAPAGE